MAFLAPPIRWLRALGGIRPEIVLLQADHKFAAFVGDKLLGAAAAKSIQENINSNQDSWDEGRATKLVSTALSNRFLAERVDTILPGAAYQLAAQLRSEHSVGTMVEAAVAAVVKEDPEAVNDLAAWLVREACSSMDDVNTKGRLLELGGRVQAVRVGGSDHMPLFNATAHLDGCVIVAQGNSKKDAEQIAARKCLLSLGYDLQILPDEKMEALVADLPLNEWNLFEVDSSRPPMLKNKESAVDWWLRGAADPKRAFRRAMLSPQVFSQHICSVDSWTRRSTSHEDAVLLVIVFAPGETNKQNTTKETSCWSMVHTDSSGKKARVTVAMEANRIIAQRVPSIIGSTMTIGSS